MMKRKHRTQSTEESPTATPEPSTKPSHKKGRKSKKDKELEASPEKKPKNGPDLSNIKPTYDLALKKVNQHLACGICKGYLVDALTVVECLHTFCKSCLLQYFEDDNNTCPKCKQLIHQSHPSHYVAFDRTMQEIVYKLVPGVFQEEKARRTEALRKKCEDEGTVDPNLKDKSKDEPQVGSNNKCFEGPPMISHHRDGDMTTVDLNPGRDLPKLARKFIRLSSMATVNTLKRYVAMCVWKDVTKYSQLDIFCKNELMGKDYSMKFIRMTRCRQLAPDVALQFEYRKHLTFG